MAISAQQFFGGQVPTQRVPVVGNENTVNKNEAQSGANFFKQQGYGSQVIGNLQNTFKSGSENVVKDVQNTQNLAQNAGGGAVAQTLAPLATLGHVAGDVASTAGGILGSFITPLLPESAKQGIANITQHISDKVNQIPGMTPEIAKGLSDVFNTATLLGGAKAVPKVGEIATDIGGKVASGVEKSAGNILKSVSENASSYPSTIVNKLTDAITTIDPQTKNILDTASIEKFNHYVKSGEEAIKNPRLLTPLEMAGEKVNNQILPTIKEDLNRIGAQKAKSLESVKNVQVPNASLDTIQFVKDSVKNAKLTAEESKLIKSVISEMQLGKSPTLGTLDKTVDLLQNTLYEKSKGLAIPVTSRVESIVNQAIGKLNNTVKTATEKALGGSKEYSVLNSAYADKIDLFNKLNKAIGEDAAKGGSLFKRFFSPQDSGTKKLFADIKEQYGIDLAEDATLAKFVMDSLGDVRSKSLLEQIPLSKGGIVTKGLQKVEQKLTNPIGKAKRVIEKRLQDQSK